MVPAFFVFLFFCSSLLAVCLEDFEVHIVDVDMRRVVRIFRGHTNRITDMVRREYHYLVQLHGRKAFFFPDNELTVFL